MDSLLDRFAELEKQEIYFASPGELNDPMEGLKDLFWLGDPVLWRNLLRHYLLSLLGTTLSSLISRDEPWVPPEISVHLSAERPPSGALGDTFREASETFFSDSSVSAALDHLSGLKTALRRAGTHFYLTHVHSAALRSVVAALARTGLIRDGGAAAQPDTRPRVEDIQALFHTISQAPLDENTLDQLFTAFDIVSEQQRIAMQYGHRDDALWRRKAFLVQEFPASYLAAVGRSLMHPPWHVASFSETCDNASAWATYASNHTGVALKFRVREIAGGVPGITLRCLNGVSSSTAGNVKYTSGSLAFRFHPIHYSERPPEVDFFKYLGQLTGPVLRSDWLVDGAGNKSERLRDALLDTDEWRRMLWDLFNATATTKMRDWAHEKEHRLVRVDMLGIPGAKRATYDFADLQGIVFGINSSIENRCRVIEIIERKCREAGRTDFEFSQARYSRASGALKEVPLGLLSETLGLAGKAGV